MRTRADADRAAFATQDLRQCGELNLTADLAARGCPGCLDLFAGGIGSEHPITFREVRPARRRREPRATGSRAARRPPPAPPGNEKPQNRFRSRPRRRRRKIPKSIVDEICDSDGGSVYEDVDDDDASDDVRAASRAAAYEDVDDDDASDDVRAAARAALPEKKPGAKDPPTVVSDESPVSTVRGPHSDSSFLEPPDTPPPPGLGADRRRKRKENLADLENRVRRIGTKVRVARAPGTPRAEVIKIPSGMRTFVLVKMLEGADGGKECLYMPSELILDE